MPPRAEILIATTWNCNLRCSYCFVFENNINEADSHMSPDMARMIVDRLDQGLSNFDEICIHLYGGEPLTNLPAVEAIVERAEHFDAGRFTFSITTNGTVLTPRVIKLLDSGKFDVILSVDGPASVHDSCRRTQTGNPTHNRVLEFLKTVREQTTCRVQGSSVIRPGWRLKEAISYLEGLGVDAFKAQAVRAPQGAPHSLSDAEKELYLQDLELIGEQVIDDLESDRSLKDDRFTKGLLQLLTGKPSDTFCGSGKYVFGITPGGDVLPCILLDNPTHKLGHITDLDFNWVQAGDEWRKTQSVRRQECQECEALFLCGGGCQAIHSVCAQDECFYTLKDAQITRDIFNHFEDNLDPLISLAGITLD